jgi:hypothetical protein
LQVYDITVPASLLSSFLRDVAIPSVELDYGAEIAATLSYLEGELATRGPATTALPFVVSEGGGEADPARPSKFSLGQNRPNPFSGTTTIEYSLRFDSHVRLAVYNVRGQQVDVLVHDYQPAGPYALEWNAGRLPSGVYFCRIKTGSFTATRKMWLLK